MIYWDKKMSTLEAVTHARQLSKQLSVQENDSLSRRVSIDKNSDMGSLKDSEGK